MTVRPTTEDDWQQIRALRLEMIRDTSEGFTETIEDALLHDEQEWRMRGRRSRAENSASFAAVDPPGRWVGVMGGWIPDASTGPLLVGVYVTPLHRGRRAGVADRLLDAVEGWAGAHGPTLRLAVHEDNRRARAFYARRGFVLTGGSEPYALDPTRRELGMVLVLEKEQ
ncbi:GNAT family N-acetyltransferase [Arthrobacter pityocampae]|uniref:GNAT family N-acetyltransferase n=1 Tax=Arthrobacter pityocampae TaxID=547334 RepID=A0A2S5J240_9MICC|nr:GNAT family N-acetyltransferase [Arthrobacter pityocampae]PPB50896.1 GNAT family N-acetyltransferase [Arthrobacter pityocampae]